MVKVKCAGCGKELKLSEEAHRKLQLLKQFFKNADTKIYCEECANLPKRGVQLEESKTNSI